ncbi:hypothetical protein FACS1894151_02180 [Spirochaetia bacterium]|nr:hypothetical protein FACS1894151_02180 [Spirochaetia bacterium]
MDKYREIKEWFDIADGDLRAAEYLMTMHHPRPDNIICNLCQQAVEKYLKGFLVFNEIEFKKIHDLVVLVRLCDSVSSDFSILLDKCTYLTPFAVAPRYPDERELTDAEVRLAIQYANDIQAFIKNLVKQ